MQGKKVLSLEIVTYAEFDKDKFNNSFKYLKTNLKFISGSTVQNMKH